MNVELNKPIQLNDLMLFLFPKKIKEDELHLRS